MALKWAPTPHNWGRIPMTADTYVTCVAAGLQEGLKEMGIEITEEQATELAKRNYNGTRFWARNSHQVQVDEEGTEVMVLEINDYVSEQ